MQLKGILPTCQQDWLLEIGRLKAEFLQGKRSFGGGGGGDDALQSYIICLLTENEAATENHNLITFMMN